ncbi:hypothetical protein F9K88_16585 [Brucella intermedia]|uniref:Uncharacterized protein n=8 Tax=Bacteria TaxID=2 RepID=U4VGD9_9HYPH|nr:hypothetical protein [Brucella intermedia]ERM01932.1 hypothetical protein Q644_02675 [Brucella intermedia 229E]NKC28709.1 hypothetical protein [Brucella ciceri]PJT27730.1 hypothetical protein CN884_04970 [Ochrobactrum sp. 30A/1000/2015]PJT40557.1 hypothetical protein CN883_03490 [Ochrobactrum sp. 27A/999/2015]PJT42807.1 hypothetical protein CN882_12565 [Ochrobactrum sp. 23A/997/2015]
MLLNDAQAQALYKAIQALNEGGCQLLTASFDAFALGEAIIDVCTHTDDRIELRSAGNVLKYTSTYPLSQLPIVCKHCDCLSEE